MAEIKRKTDKRFTHRTKFPPDVRGKLTFILDNYSLGITPMRMMLDGREVDVITYRVEEGDDFLYEPLAIFVDDELLEQLTEVPEPEDLTE